MSDDMSREEERKLAAQVDIGKELDDMLALVQHNTAQNPPSVEEGDEDALNQAFDEETPSESEKPAKKEKATARREEPRETEERVQEETEETPATSEEDEEPLEEETETETETEAEEEEDPTSDSARIARLEEQNKALLKLLNDQLGGAQPQPRLAEEEAPPTPVRAEPSPSPSIELSDEQYQQILDDPREFVKFVQGVAATERQRTLMEMGPIIAQQVETRSIINGFFSQEGNKDLLPVINYVRTEIDRVEQENPGMTVIEVLREAAGRTRSKLGLVGQAGRPAAKPKGQQGGAQRQSGAFAGGGSARRTPPILTKKPAPDSPEGIADDIARMMNAGQ